MELPKPRAPHGLIKPFTRPNWIRWPVKQTKTLQARQIDAVTLYFVRKVT
jgi:hypothetical protein